EGTTLAEWQRSHSWEEVLPIYAAAGQGLLAAHACGLVHRDFKPDNVLVCKDGRPRVADFGLARTQSSDPGASSSVDSERPRDAAASAPAGSNLLITPLTQA